MSSEKLLRKRAEVPMALLRLKPVVAICPQYRRLSVCTGFRAEAESEYRHSRRALSRKTQEETGAEFTCPPGSASRSYSLPEASGSNTHSV